MIDLDPAWADALAARLYHQYCRAVDEGDLEALARLVTPDVLMTRVDGTRQGVERFLDVYREFNAAKRGPSQHVVSNVLADVDVGRVRTRACFQATMLEPDQTRVVLGTYADVHVEQDGEFRISHKVIDVQRVIVLPGSA